MKNYYYQLTFMVITVFSGLASYAGQCETLGDGNWSDPSTWSCGRVPGSGDTIIIRASDSIYVANSQNGLTGVWLQVYGHLDFKNAARIVFEYGDTNIAPSMVTFYTGSKCTDGNGSSGLSFGAGGSGCDVYRPGQGTNPGVYPTIPGSYYDGCVWASYLPITDLKVDISLQAEKISFDWSLHENDMIEHYIVEGHLENGETYVLDYLPSQQLGYEEVSYKYSNYIGNLNTISITAFTNVNSRLNIANSKLIGSQYLDPSKISSSPNPFKNQINIYCTEAVDIEIYTVEGKLMFYGNSSNEYQIDSESFKSGMYYLMVKYKGEIVKHQKIIKQ